MTLRSRSARAVAAIGLLTGFYLFGLSFAIGLLWLARKSWLAFLDGIARRGEGVCEPWLVCYGHTIAMFLVLLGLAVLWSLRPRFNEFEPTSPAIQSTDEPELFELIRAAAAAAEAPAPIRVHLQLDADVCIADVGGLVGFGGKSVLVIGLPLFGVLSRNELRTVLVWELARRSTHVTGIPAALGRPHRSLERILRAGDHAFFNVAHVVYARATRTVSNAIELHEASAAYAHAAEIVTPARLQTTLEKIAPVAGEFDLFYGTRVEPAIEAGVLPPFVEGFGRFLHRVQELDTRDSAVQILQRLPRHERGVLAAIGVNVDRLRSIFWQDYGREVVLPQWRKCMNEHLPALVRVSFESPPLGVAATAAVGRALNYPMAKLADDRELATRMVEAMAAAVGIRLADAGWDCVPDLAGGLRLMDAGLKSDAAEPAIPVVMRRGEMTIVPLKLAHDVVINEALERWRQMCAVAGLSGPLASA